MSLSDQDKPQAENPYRPPRPVDDNEDSASIQCSFCRRPWSEVGPLVEAPQRQAYICRQCAQTSLSTIEQSEDGPSGPWRTVIGFVVLSLALMLGAWLLYSLLLDDADPELLLWVVLLVLVIYVGDRVATFARRSGRR